MTSFIMTGNSPQQILNKTKTNTCRVISKHNSIPAAGKWSTHLYDFTRATFADGEYLKVPYCLKSEGWEDDPEDDTRTRVYCRWKVGDLIRIKETWRCTPGFLPGEPHPDGFTEVALDYDEDSQAVNRYAPNDWVDHDYADQNDELDWRWRSPLFMPQWASRITVKVLEVKAFRVTDIPDVTVYDEGLTGSFRYDIDGQPWIGVGKATGRALWDFERLWDSKNGKRKGCEWASKPLVWSTRFELVTK